MFDLWLRINENNHVDGINIRRKKMKALTETEKQALKEVIEYWEANVRWTSSHSWLIDRAFRKLEISKS